MNKTHGPDAYKDIRKDRVLQVLEDSPRAIPAIRMKQPYRCPDKILPQIEKSHFGKRSTSINPVASTRLLDLPFTYKEAPHPKRNRVRHSFDNNVVNAYGQTFDYFKKIQ